MSDTIAAIATPLSTGGISVLRISGPDAIPVAKRVFFPVSAKPLCEMAGYTAVYGKIGDASGNHLDDGIATVFRAPKSYTGEDVVEISCHGGIYITREILRRITSCGARLADAGEFSKRAFLNGKLNLTQAESIMDLISSRNTQSLKSARAQMNGALYQKIHAAQDSLLELSGHLAAWVDYPEEEIESVEEDKLLKSLKVLKADLKQLLKTFDTGKLIREGIETAIVGRTNVGKSTLMNLLSGCEKSIVTEIEGTTRDVIEETVNLGNVVLRLADTAGIRETDDLVEQKGVALSLERMQSAALVLAVFDYSSPLNQQDIEMLETLSGLQTPVIAVINKTDLDCALDEDKICSQITHVVYTSNQDKESLGRLSNEIEQVLSISEFDPSAGMIVNERQYWCCHAALQSVGEAAEILQSGMTLDAVTIVIDSALDSLLELTGEKVTDKVVEQVFHNFCVGK